MEPTCRRHGHPGRARSRGPAASLAVTFANTNTQAHAKANADPDPAADTSTYAATDTAANTSAHPSTDAGAGSHRRFTLEGPNAAARGGRDRGRPLAACRRTPGRGLSSGGGHRPGRAGCQRRRHGIAVEYAEPVLA